MLSREYLQTHKKPAVVVGLGLVALMSVGMVIRARSGEAKYMTAKVQRADIMATVQATGTINPLTTVPVGSYVSGTVHFIFADFNSQVRAGQVLAQLDPAIYEAAVIQARGNPRADPGASRRRVLPDFVGGCQEAANCIEAPHGGNRTSAGDGKDGFLG
jgi:multidrug efflux pump subunit AcrA (membrane-fusion protein)